MTARPWLRWVLLGAVILGGVLLIGRPGGDGAPLDPDSTEPSGTRALVLLLGELGAEVDVTSDSPSDDDDVALVLGDDLDDDGRDDLRRWVERGGTLVVADPASPLVPFPAASATVFATSTGCDIPALADVDEVATSGGGTWVVGPGDEGCYDADGGSFVAVTGRGEGTVVAVGGAGALVNASLGSADNAPLAGALLAPTEGTRVAFLQPPVVGTGEEGLTDLIGDNVRGALWQLLLAFVVYALWRARRLGRPVPDDQPVELAASELVVAVGNLLQQAGRRDQAGTLLRGDLRRQLAERLGLPGAAPAEQVAEVAAARTGIPAATLYAALAPVPIAGDGDLVTLAATAEGIRQEVDHAR